MHTLRVRVCVVFIHASAPYRKADTWSRVGWVVRCCAQVGRDRKYGRPHKYLKAPRDLSPRSSSSPSLSVCLSVFFFFLSLSFLLLGKGRLKGRKRNRERSTAKKREGKRLNSFLSGLSKKALFCSLPFPKQKHFPPSRVVFSVVTMDNGRRASSCAFSCLQVLHVRSRLLSSSSSSQADQDKAIQFASIDAIRAQTASARDERLRVMERKQQLLGDLNQTAQVSLPSSYTSDNARSSPPSSSFLF